jgi:hypothetical protein
MFIEIAELCDVLQRSERKIMHNGGIFLIFHDPLLMPDNNRKKTNKNKVQPKGGGF